MIELTFRTLAIEESLSSSHIWRCIIIKNYTVIIIRGRWTRNSSISSFYLRIVRHEVLKLLVVMILRIIRNINGLKLFHIRICFLLLTCNILRNKSISRQNPCNWYSSHSAITVTFNTISVTVLQRTVIIVLSTSATSWPVTTISYLSLLVIILLIRGVTISLVNFIIFS